MLIPMLAAILEQQILEFTNTYKWSPIPPFVKERIGD
jgi:hypothetical protein